MNNSLVNHDMRLSESAINVTCHVKNAGKTIQIILWFSIHYYKNVQMNLERYVKKEKLPSIQDDKLINGDENQTSAF